MISSIDYVIECRDFRVPITSINPMFEEALGDKQRLIVYTKRDLGGGTDAVTRKVNKLKSTPSRMIAANKYFI